MTNHRRAGHERAVLGGDGGFGAGPDGLGSGRLAPPAGAGGGPDLALYRGQLDELARDVAAGRLAPADRAARLEIERRLLAAAGAPPVASGGTGRRGPLTMGLAVLILGGGCALTWPLAPHLPDQPLALRADELATAAAHLRQAQMIEVAGLAARLAAAPGDLAGWQRLGRSYMVLGRFPAAARPLPKPLNWRRKTSIFCWPGPRPCCRRYAPPAAGPVRRGHGARHRGSAG